MAWPRCPACRMGPVPRVDGASAVDGEEVAIVRAYACPCGWSAWTGEVLISDRPASPWVRRRVDGKTDSWVFVAWKTAVWELLGRIG